MLAMGLSEITARQSQMALDKQTHPLTRGERTGQVLAKPCPRKAVSAFSSFNFSPKVIRRVVMMWVCLPLSLKGVWGLLFERGIDICYETVRLSSASRHGCELPTVEVGSTDRRNALSGRFVANTRHSAFARLATHDDCNCAASWRASLLTYGGRLPEPKTERKPSRAIQGKYSRR